MTKKHTTPPVPPLTLEQAHELIHKLLDPGKDHEKALSDKAFGGF